MNTPHTPIHKDVKKGIVICCGITGVLVILGIAMPHYLGIIFEESKCRKLCSVIATVSGTQIGLIFASLAFVANIIQKHRCRIEDTILDTCSAFNTSIKYTVFDIAEIKNRYNTIAPQTSITLLQRMLKTHEKLATYRTYIRHMGSIPLILSAAVSFMSCIARVLLTLCFTALSIKYLCVMCCCCRTSRIQSK